MGLNGLSKEYILMSIKPHYADLIYTERKRFEYRKRAQSWLTYRSSYMRRRRSRK